MNESFEVHPGHLESKCIISLENKYHQIVSLVHTTGFRGHLGWNVNIIF